MAMPDQFTQPFGASKGPPSLHGSGKNEHHTSSIWQAAIDRYYAELRRGGVKGPAIDHDLWRIHSPDDLFQQSNALSPADSRGCDDPLGRDEWSGGGCNMGLDQIDHEEARRIEKDSLGYGPICILRR
ncbi:hypothetical protein P170DRAFT_421425 [Aspergillus steynii IBT 23096]|uniref:Uncharacterized protein n=1 Tax=Aspergillus steynii IBT 23096 TaxID=1392250 RepID=A0A2I2GPG7_9EURO|nr:uncharacterized protein P170DRAFT_421425 [Aspergillus steynii IBT 23096]PLB54771.1 hypothetical protein P170DRAFT_421425 [Aspergillus steynii IBT 23096]